MTDDKKTAPKVEIESMPAATAAEEKLVEEIVEKLQAMVSQFVARGIHPATTLGVVLSVTLSALRNSGMSASELSELLTHFNQMWSLLKETAGNA